MMFITLTSSSQTLNYVSKPYGHGYSVNVIQPTIENFIKLCDMNPSQFVSAMKSCGYFEMEQSSYDPIDYWNGSLDNFAYAHAVNSFSRYNSGWIVYMAEKEYIYPNNSFSNFKNSLAEYYYEHTDRIYDGMASAVYKIEKNGYTYGIFVTDMGKAWDVHAFRFNK